VGVAAGFAADGGDTSDRKSRRVTRAAFLSVHFTASAQTNTILRGKGCVNKKTVLGIVIAIVLTLALTFYLRSLHARLTIIPLRLIVILFVQVVLFSMALFTNTVIEKRPFSDLGYSLDNISGQLTWAAALFVGLSFVFIGVPLLGGMKNIFPARDNLLFAIPYKLFVGFAEETLFRGYLMSAFKRLIKSKIAAVLLTSAVFGGWHFIFSGNVLQVIITFVIGLAFAVPVMYAKKCTVLSTSLAHGAYGSLLAVLSWI
jgi:membrane protease YdiL (CAAX protease family)